MKNREFASTAFKCLGIYSLLQIIPNLSALFFMRSIYESKLFFDNSFFIILGAALPIILYLLVGLSLITFSTKLANRLVNADDVEEQVPISSINFQATILSSIGIYLICNVIPQISRLILSFKNEKELIPSYAFVDFIYEHWVEVSANSIEFIIGLILVFYSIAFSKILISLRKD